MIALLTIVLAGVQTVDCGLWTVDFAQEETGIPISPFSGLEGGGVFAQFPDDWGLSERGHSGWFGSAVLGGVVGEDGAEFMARFKYLQWDRLKILEADGVTLAAPIEARFQSGMVDLSVDGGIGPLRVGLTVGGGLYLLKHDFEREVAPAGEAGLYLRLKPVSWAYVEVGGLATALRDDFNREFTRTDVMLTGHGAVGIELRF